VSNGATYALGSVPSAGCSTNDQAGLSGVQTAATVAVSGGNSNGVGTFTATCSGAKDKADNSAAPVSVTYYVQYLPSGVSGILQPINPDNTSVFSRGRAVPVKFRIAGDPATGFATAAWSLTRIQVNCSSFDAVDSIVEEVPSNTPSTVFRYDATADQYIYNADFSTKAAGTCWKVQVKLDDAPATIMTSAIFKLQK
jgi:hypothetical protein